MAYGNDNMVDDAVPPADATLVARLRNLPVAGPTDGFFERALSHAEETGQSTTRRTTRRKGIGQRLGAAIAAVVVASVVALFGYDMRTTAPGADIPEVAVALNVETPVNVVFTSDTYLESARVSLQLPEGLRLAGHDGSSLSWTTDLAQGKNVLTLPLIASAPGTERLLVARLEHADRTKTFQLKVVTL